MIRNSVLLLLLGLILITSISYSSESTTDISYILPDGGHFTKDTDKWWTNWDNIYNTSSVYFYNQNGEAYVSLCCFACPSTKSAARIGISNNLDISNIKRDAIQFTITFRGSPSNGYIYGYMQPEINSAYPGNMTGYRKPGESPGYLQELSIKAINIDTTSPIRLKFNYATFTITTVWTTYSWRFIPTHQNYFKLDFVGFKYNADPFPELPGPLLNTEVQIKEIKLEAVRFY